MHSKYKSKNDLFSEVKCIVKLISHGHLFCKAVTVIEVDDDAVGLGVAVSEATVPCRHRMFCLLAALVALLKTHPVLLVWELGRAATRPTKRFTL